MSNVEAPDGLVRKVDWLISTGLLLNPQSVIKNVFLYA